MLSVRTILSRRVIFRLNHTSWPRHNSTRPSGSPAHNALDQEQLEKESPAREEAIPLTAPPSKSQEPPLPDTPPAASSRSDSASGKPDSWKELSQYDLDVVKQRIRDWTEQAAINLRERADGFTAQTKTRFSQLGAELNKATGYEEIEALKKEVAAQGSLLYKIKLKMLLTLGFKRRKSN
jgi:sensitive to high expression protein 9